MNIDFTILLGLKVSFIAILVDTFIGWLIAFANGNFDVKKCPQFLASNVLPYIGALIIIGLASNYDNTWMPLFDICCGLVTAKFGYEAVKEKIIGFFNRNKK